jgi:hypothetical protein
LAVNYIDFTAMNPTWFIAPELKQEQTPKENKFPTGHAFEIILPNLPPTPKVLVWGFNPQIQEAKPDLTTCPPAEGGAGRTIKFV